jgi:hypothetical protein
MAHIPVNHHLRPLYRTVAALIGLYSLTLGAMGLASAGSVGVFQQHDLPRVLGLPVNPAFAGISVVVGATVLLATLVGRNVDHYVYLAAGVTYQAAGLLMLALLRTDLNPLGFSIGSCVVSFGLGLGTLTAGLYGKVGPGPAGDRPAAGSGRAVSAVPSS